VLWEVYVLLVALNVLLLVLGGMSLFDALCNAFGTVATGGFSVRNGGIGDHRSPWGEWVTTAFMFLGGTNFALHYALLHGRWRRVAYDREFQVYVGILLAAITLLAVLAATAGPGLGGVEPTVRTCAFQAVSIMTCTGFATADFDGWHTGARALLVLLMFVGGCAGSTAGSIKVIRHVLLAKLGLRELRQLVSPHEVIHVKLGDQTVDRDVLTNVLVFVVLYLATFGLGTIYVSLFGLDLETAATSVAACLGNVGPGLAKVGPMANYGWIPEPGIWFLSLCMLLGRLELFGVLILFHPVAWRR
jgi:trk system potassium uptake protein TrkH